MRKIAALIIGPVADAYELQMGNRRAWGPFLNPEEGRGGLFLLDYRGQAWHTC
jgi:hypothetical protein